MVESALSSELSPDARVLRGEAEEQPDS